MMTTDTLQELFVAPGHIRNDDFERALRMAEQEHAPLEEIIVREGFVSDENFGQTIAEHLDIPYINLKNLTIDPETLKIIPEVVARAQRAVVFEYIPHTGKAPVVKVATPLLDNYEFFKLLEKKIGAQVALFYATPLQVEEILKRYKSELRNKVHILLQDLETNPKNEGGIVALVESILEYASDSFASDIHIEPFENNIVVRFRIDGILHKVIEYPTEIHPKIASRIKIMARMRIDEHFAAQDGRFDFKKERSIFDVRISIIPTTHGENIVMRLLSRNAQVLHLDDLGIAPGDLEKIKRAILKPHGMLLSVGPTGSGKTTSLYTLLQILNKPEVNIMTIEDPVEYEIEGVRHIQVNAQKNITFSSGLRSIVRQDPNIVMVGEIRDTETATIAIDAAMTGHFILSTLHANDASTTFPRLAEMGIEPFLIASAVNVVIAQRLVRKICEQCRGSYQLDEEKLALLDSTLQHYLARAAEQRDLTHVSFFRGYGTIKDNQVCPACAGVGYHGRIGIFEVMEITPSLRPLIVQKASADIIAKQAIAEGMTPMLQDGIRKVFLGITTLEEVIRVTKT